MITTFWNWIITTVTAAAQTLTNLYNNSILNPFFNLLLVVVGLAVVLKYILFPLFGISYSGASDMVDKRVERRNKSLDMISDEYWK